MVRREDDAGQSGVGRKFIDARHRYDLRNGQFLGIIINVVQAILESGREIRELRRPASAG